MLARRQLPASYSEFNQRHHAPYGRPVAGPLRTFGHRNPLYVRMAGPYAWQVNNSIREFEYPWAFTEIQKLGSQLTIADIGASLAGMQFTLAQEGHHVHAIDPGMNASGLGWQVSPRFHQFLSRMYRAPVSLHPTTLQEAGLADDSVDVMLSISTIEHFGPGDLEGFAQDTRRVLKPGGHVVLTIDLFLDLAPFTDRATNEYGGNVDVAQLLRSLGAELVVGEPSELYGFPEFDPRAVQARLANLAVGSGYPALAQCVVARVP